MRQVPQVSSCYGLPEEGFGLARGTRFRGVSAVCLENDRNRNVGIDRTRVCFGALVRGCRVCRGRWTGPEDRKDRRKTMSNSSLTKGGFVIPKWLPRRHWELPVIAAENKPKKAKKFFLVVCPKASNEHLCSIVLQERRTIATSGMGG